MNWFRLNRFLGTFLIAFSLATLVALIFLWSAKSRFDAAQARFNESATELNRLQRLSPFPSEMNLQKMKTQAQDYGTELAKLKEDLKTHMAPIVPMTSSEFQTRLNQARTAFAERARANKVKLPDNFFLGFEEFAASLPDTAAAPLLGQELAQVELLLNILVDAHVDAISALRRVPVAERSATVPATAPAIARKPSPPAAATSAALIERNVIDMTFAASPSAARRVINQIATGQQQFYIVRTLHVLNEKEKGPPRAGAAGVPPAPIAASSPGAAASALNFIVGNEHVQASARIEMLRSTF